MREAPHVAQDAFGQVARAADCSSDVTATMIVIHVGVGSP